MRNILFINHTQKSCGVYQIGRRIAGFLADSTRYAYHYREVRSAQEIVSAINETQPTAIIYNYYISTLPMVVPQFADFVRGHGIRQFGVIHDPMDMDFIRYVETVFDEWIVHDETNPILSDRRFTACRPIPRADPLPPPERFTVGSHGFGVSPWKAFDLIVEAVQLEYDDADINFNIGAAAFGDEQGKAIQYWKDVCSAKVSKPGIRLNITSHFFEEEDELIRYLQGNSLNIYFYRDTSFVTGPAGSADLAIASRRPLVVNSSPMYRHLSSQIGAYGRNGGLRILGNNEAVVQRLYDAWSPQRMVSDYERMLDRCLQMPIPD